MMRRQNPANSDKVIRHRLLVYGGLGDVASNWIIPALDSLKSEYAIEYAIVDLRDKGPGVYYKYGNEPLANYESAIVATPNDTHAEIAIKTLDAGLHVLCEKPLAHTLESAESLLTESRRHPHLVAMLTNHYVYDPAIRNVIDHWEEYMIHIGKLKSIEAKLLESLTVNGREWVLETRRSGGGVVLDLGIHMIPVIGKLFGYEDIRVQKAIIAREETAPGDGETYGDITLTINGIHTRIEVGKWIPFSQIDIVFNGLIGKLEIDVEEREIRVNGRIEGPFPEHKKGSYCTLLADFFTAIETHKSPWTTFEEGYSMLKVIQSIYEIAAEDKKFSSRRI